MIVGRDGSWTNCYDEQKHSYIPTLYTYIPIYLYTCIPVCLYTPLAT